MSRITEKLALVAFPRLSLELIRAYFRIDVEDMQHIPRRGKVLIISNHSGCSGLDAVMLGYTLQKELRRIPRILALWNIFQSFPSLASVAEKMGLKEASAKNGLNLLRKNHMTVIFPEGVRGSFKPTSVRYQLQPFHTGFVRMGIISKAPVIPCVIIGAEESNINLGQIQFKKFMKGLTVPVPFNILPLPAKWKIKFLPPLDLSKYSEQDTSDREKMQKIADETRIMMQAAINQELQKRRYIFFPEKPLIA